MKDGDENVGDRLQHSQSDHILSEAYEGLGSENEKVRKDDGNSGQNYDDDDEDGNENTGDDKKDGDDQNGDGEEDEDDDEEEDGDEDGKDKEVGDVEEETENDLLKRLNTEVKNFVSLKGITISSTNPRFDICARTGDSLKAPLMPAIAVKLMVSCEI